jgi:hypothetical protein
VTGAEFLGGVGKQLANAEPSVLLAATMAQEIVSTKKKPKPHVPPVGVTDVDTTTPEQKFELALGSMYQAICEHFTSHGFDNPDQDQCQRIAWELMLAAHLHCDEAGTCWGCFVEEYLKVEVEILTESAHGSSEGETVN